MHEHKGTNLAKRDSTRILTTKTVKSQIFLGGGFNFNFKLALSDYGPKNLEGWRY